MAQLPRPVRKECSRTTWRGLEVRRALVPDDSRRALRELLAAYYPYADLELLAVIISRLGADM